MLFIKYLCLAGEIRILSRIPNSQDQISIKVARLRNELLLDPDLKAMTWLVDLGELLAKSHSKDLGRIDTIVKRNPDIPYLQQLGKSALGNSKLAGSMPSDASKLYGKNILNFLQLIITKEGQMNLNFEDDLVKGCCITNAGNVVNERVNSLL